MSRFTLHHLVAVAAFMPAWAVPVACAGIFAAGAAWSFLRLRYGGVWPGLVSHLAADVAVFAVGAFILFGA